MADLSWTKSHRSRGSSLIEMPFAIWLLIIGIVMPLMCFVTMGIRYTLFLNSARQAVHAAAHAQSFQQDFPQSVSSRSIAQTTAQACCQAFSGITLNTVSTSIVITPISGGAPIVHPGALSAAADEENYLYQIRVKLTGQLTPLIASNAAFGFDIPGLTIPYNVDVSAEEVSENTQGLNR